MATNFYAVMIDRNSTEVAASAKYSDGYFPIRIEGHPNIHSALCRMIDMWSGAWAGGIIPDGNDPFEDFITGGLFDE